MQIKSLASLACTTVVPFVVSISTMMQTAQARVNSPKTPDVVQTQKNIGSEVPSWGAHLPEGWYAFQSLKANNRTSGVCYLQAKDASNLNSTTPVAVVKLMVRGKKGLVNTSQYTYGTQDKINSAAPDNNHPLSTGKFLNLLKWNLGQVVYSSSNQVDCITGKTVMPLPATNNTLSVNVN